MGAWRTGLGAGGGTGAGGLTRGLCDRENFFVFSRKIPIWIDMKMYITWRAGSSSAFLAGAGRRRLLLASRSDMMRL